MILMWAGLSNSFPAKCPDKVRVSPSENRAGGEQEEPYAEKMLTIMSTWKDSCALGNKARRPCQLAVKHCAYLNKMYTSCLPPAWSTRVPSLTWMFHKFPGVVNLSDPGNLLVIFERRPTRTQYPRVHVWKGSWVALTTCWLVSPPLWSRLTKSGACSPTTQLELQLAQSHVHWPLRAPDRPRAAHRSLQCIQTNCGLLGIVTSLCFNGKTKQPFNKSSDMHR